MKCFIRCRLLSGCTAFGLSLSSWAGNVTLTWDASQQPATLGEAATGQIVLTYDGETVSALTATPVDGGTIVLTGDALAASAAAKITLAAAGELVFSNAVSSTKNITVESSVTDGRTIIYSGTNLDTSYTTLFANQKLEDWMPLTTGNKNGKGWWQTDGVSTYNIRRETDGTLTAQRQADLGSVGAQYGNGIGIVKFQLKQVGDDIAGRVIYAGYWKKSVGPLGTDFDLVLANAKAYSFVNQGVSTPSRGTGYGINKMTLSRVRGLPTVRFAGGLDVGGILSVSQYAHLVYERAETGSVKTGYVADSNGILTFRDPVSNFDPSRNAAGTSALSSGIAGSGTVEFEATDAVTGDETRDASSVAASGWMAKDEWKTVAVNKQLSNLKEASAVFGGYSMNAAWRGMSCPLQLFTLAADGQSATGQFQRLFGGWSGISTTNRCASFITEFRQNGDDVQMRVTKVTCYGGNNTSAATAIAKFGTDLSSELSYSLATNETSSSMNYGIHDPTFVFASDYAVRLVTMSRYPGIRNMTGSTSVPGCKAQLVVKGTQNTILRYAPDANDGHVLPSTDGLLRVQEGGELVQLKVCTSTGRLWVDDLAQIYLETGGVFRQQANWGVGITQRVDIIGGEYRVRDISSVNSGRCVLNLLTLSGDVSLHSAQGASDVVRAGYMQDAVWTVRGTTSSSCDVPLVIWGAAEAAAGGNTMTFAVNDVTGDDASDFIMNAAVSVDSVETDVLGIYKIGGGTMQLNASYGVRGKTTIVGDGVLLVNGSSLTSSADPYTLDGGTLATAANTVNSVGVLTVGASGGGITLGAGATLAFADSSTATWTGTEKVIVTGFAEKSIRFGTSPKGLSAAQVRRFRTAEGRSLVVGKDGYLSVPGCILVIR